MQKILPLLTGLFLVSASAANYPSKKLFLAKNAFHTIAFRKEASDKAANDSIRIPFQPGTESFPEDSEPDDFLDEASAIDEMGSDSTMLAEERLDTILVDMRKAAIPLESRRITSPYGFRHYRIHKGIDIGLKTGDTIRAAFPGKVTRVRYERRGYGKYIVLEHRDCGITRTVYAHLSKQLVKVGDTVDAGSAIGLGGNTGRSTGPHLHFETRIGDMPLDPAIFFDFGNHAFLSEEVRLPRKRAEEEYAALQKEASKHRYHRIRPGDTLGKIARKYHTSIGRLCALNGIKRNSVLRIGRILRCS